MSRRVDTPSTAEARKLQDEGELFEALNTGMSCAMGAARAIAVYRSEGRWFQVALGIEKLRAAAVRLAVEKRRPGLLLPNGNLRGN